MTPLLSADQLDLRGDGDDRRVEAACVLQPGTSWGPYPGIVQSEAGAAEEAESEVGSRPGVRGQQPACQRDEVAHTHIHTHTLSLIMTSSGCQFDLI